MSAMKAMTPAEARAAMTDVMRWTDGKGGWLEVAPLTVTSGGLPVVTTGTQGFAVDPLEIPEITNAMYEAAGTVPPVMLGRPDLDAARRDDGTVLIGGMRLWKAEDGGVGFGIGGNRQVLPEALARQAAALAVALADEQPEPDPEDVDSLATTLHDARCDEGAACNLGPTVDDRKSARAVLLAGWKREVPGD